VRLAGVDGGVIWNLFESFKVGLCVISTSVKNSFKGLEYCVGETWY
jgi:hypothetical protein